MTNGTKQILLNNLQVLGDTPHIHTLDSEQRSRTKGLWKNKLSFDILSYENTTSKEITSYSTLGLSDYELRDNKNNGQPARIELLSALKKDTDFLELTEDPDDKEMFYEDSLFYIACYLVNENDFIWYGDTWVNFFSNEYQAITDHSDMEHLFFMSPTLLSDKLKPIEIDGNKINWLLCVPISEAELQYRNNKGPDALKELLINNKIDVSDLFRNSVI